MQLLYILLIQSNSVRFVYVGCCLGGIFLFFLCPCFFGGFSVLLPPPKKMLVSRLSTLNRTLGVNQCVNVCVFCDDKLQNIEFFD